MKQLTLHIGTSKTGTSSLQSTFAANRQGLLESGVLYPGHGKSTNHHRFAWDVRDNPTGARKMVEVALASAQPKVLLSSEAIYLSVAGVSAYRAGDQYWDRRYGYLDALERATAGAHRTVAVVYRRPDEFAESLYGTAVLRDDVRIPFREFRDVIRPLVHYERQTQAFRERFEEVRVVDFAEVRGNLIDRMASVLSLGGLADRPPDRNISPDVGVILWVLDKHRREIVRGNLRRFVKAAAVRSIFAGRQATLWESVAARKEYCRSVGWAGPVETSERQFVDGLTEREQRAMNAAYARFHIAWLFGLRPRQG